MQRRVPNKVPPDATIDNHETLEYKRAALWRRIVAHMFDGIILTLCGSSLTYSYSSIVTLSLPGILVGLILLTVGVWLLFTNLSSNRGKNLLGIYVIDAATNTRKESLLARSIIQYIFAYGLFGIPHLLDMIFLTCGDGRTCVDRVFNTLVVEEKN